MRTDDPAPDAVGRRAFEEAVLPVDVQPEPTEERLGPPASGEDEHDLGPSGLDLDAEELGASSTLDRPQAPTALPAAHGAILVRFD